LPEDPLLAERAAFCGRTVDVLVEAARVELQRDDVVSVSTREDPEQRADAIARLESRGKALREQRARAAVWLADAERERSRRGIDPSATESMARVLLAWSDPARVGDTSGRAADALSELRAGVANGSLAPGATARLRFSLAVLAGERPVDEPPIGLPPLAGNEGDFESAVEVLAWARLRDELGLHARIEAWIRHTGNGGRGDPTILGVGLGNAERVYLRGLIAVVADDVDGARAWFRLLLSLDDLDRDLRDDATARLRALEILADD
jgi:hypothetical protein